MSTKHTVPANFGKYTQGQVLTEKQDIIDYHRAMLNEGLMGQSPLTDDDIWGVIELFPGDSEDIEVMRIEKLEQKSE